MAKMGYKYGSGLGREEQGMSMALQVEKTSRRGGKILHEKDIATKGLPPPFLRVWLLGWLCNINTIVWVGVDGAF